MKSAGSAISKAIHQPLVWLLILCPALLSCSSNKNEGYQITLIPTGLSAGDTLYLGAYYGQSIRLHSTATLNSQGVAVFEGDTPLASGMYAIATPRQHESLNFLISSTQPQKFTVRYSAANLARSLQFEGSPENSAFVKYLYSAQAYQMTYDDPVIRDYPMLALYIKNKTDVWYLVKNADDYKRRYFQHTSFSDERITRMPLLEEKLTSYFYYVLNPLDTFELRASIDTVLSYAASCDSVYKMAASHLYKLLLYSSIPEHREMVGYLAMRYILPTKQAYLFDKPFVNQVQSMLNASNGMVGSLAPDLALQAIGGESVRISDLSAKRLVLFFADPECDACRQAAPLLFQLYSKYKRKGFEVCSVYLGSNEKVWREYNKQNGYGWINVWLNSEGDDIYQTYDIKAIPTLYLLDEDKRILAQDIMLSQLEQALSKDLR